MSMMWKGLKAWLLWVSYFTSNSQFYTRCHFCAILLARIYKLALLRLFTDYSRRWFEQEKTSYRNRFTVNWSKTQALFSNLLHRPRFCPVRSHSLCHFIAWMCQKWKTPTQYSMSPTYVLVFSQTVQLMIPMVQTRCEVVQRNVLIKW